MYITTTVAEQQHDITGYVIMSNAFYPTPILLSHIKLDYMGASFMPMFTTANSQLKCIS